MKSTKQQYKKLLSLILAFALALSIFSIMPLSASAAIGDVFTLDGLTYAVTDEIYGSYSVSVTGFDNSTKDVVIPEKVSNNGIEYSVTAIAVTAFNGNTDIVSVNVPGTVKVMSGAIFENCTALKNVTLNEGIETITGFVFKGAGIEKIKFPKSLKTVDGNVFITSTTLKEVYVYSDVTFSGRVFEKCTNLSDIYCYSANATFAVLNFFRLDKTKITFHGFSGSAVETFANAKGYNFALIEEEQTTSPVESTEATEIIETTENTEATEQTENTESTEATESTENTEATVATEITEQTTEPTTEPTTESTTEPTTEPDTSIFTWKKIQNDTAVEITGFKPDYSSKSTVEIPSEINGLPVTVIGESAFEGSQIMFLTIPSSVIVINDKAFNYCHGLTEITFAENSQLQKIGNEAFGRSNGGDDGLNSVELPASLKALGYRAFYNRANLLTVKVYSKDVYFGDASKGKEVFDLNTGTSNLKIYGYTDSTAQAYAAEAGHTFRYLDLNTDELQKLYDQAQAIDSSLYTQESYANLTAAMKAAKRMLANKDATPAQVEQCTADLQAAIDNLVVYVEPTTTEPITTEPTTAPNEYIEYTVGEVDNADGINVKDATMILKHIVQLVTLSDETLLAADVNGDNLITVTDATLILKWIVGIETPAEYKIGELVKIEVNPDPLETTTPPEPSTASDDVATDMFYLPNYVSWLTDMGGKMWIYNEATSDFMIMDYDPDGNYFYTELPENWTELSFYRTPFDTTEEDFDINSSWSDETQSGIILNKWINLESRGSHNCFKITADGVGIYTTYDPNVTPEDERTIYFDNSKTKWSSVYIYGWSFGIYNEFIQMEPEGNDIWSYTFYDQLPIDGVNGFLFVDSSSWAGATQTNDLATEEGKNLFVPTLGGNKLSGNWEVYTP